MLITFDKEKLSRPSLVVFKEETDDIIKQLEEELARHPDGVGLAAPQIGIFKRVAIIRYKGHHYNLINPKVIFRKLPFINNNEGCLSFPGIKVSTLRHKNVLVSALNKEFTKPQTYRFFDPIASIAEHEIDHLDGLLFFNRMMV